MLQCDPVGGGGGQQEQTIIVDCQMCLVESTFLALLAVGEELSVAGDTVSWPAFLDMIRDESDLPNTGECSGRALGKHG